MDSNKLIVERTLDVGLCLSVLLDDDIFDVISEDGVQIESIKPDVINDYWLSIKVGADVIGVCQLKPKTKTCCEVHIQILPIYRSEHSMSAGYELIDWTRSNTEFKSVIAEIADIYRNVQRFVLAIGFDVVGNVPNVLTKNGDTHNMTIFNKVL